MIYLWVFQVELFACARVHVTYNVALRFMDSVEELRDAKPGTRGALYVLDICTARTDELR